MCQQDFDFGLTVGKMGRECFTSSRSAKGGKRRAPSSQGNSFEDRSRGSEISGLDHQLPSMEKVESGWSNGPHIAGACLSCSRQRRVDYARNDFGECHQHHQLPKIMWRQVDRAFSQFDSYRRGVDDGEIDTANSHLLLHHHHPPSPSPAQENGVSLKKKYRFEPFFNGLSRAIWIQLGMLILLSLTLQGVTGVRINKLQVPGIVQNGTDDAVILDCDYSLDDKEKEGLVVKWYFTNKQNQVYQWIPHNKPAGLGILKGKLNLNYQAGIDNYTMNRALQIMQPTTEMSGTWICHVSTFEGDAMEAARMVVFAPEKEMEMKVFENRRGKYVNISCWATRVYPKPTMTFHHEEQELPGVMVSYEEYGGAFDIRAYKIMEEATLSSMDGSSFDCELSIPAANYQKRKTLVFEPGSLELKDAMRMSHGAPRALLDIRLLLIPYLIILAITRH